MTSFGCVPRVGLCMCRVLMMSEIGSRMCVWVCERLGFWFLVWEEMCDGEGG